MRQIDHLVILMMENRSFDHYLGSLSLLEGRDKVEGLVPPLPSNPDLQNFPIPAWNMDGIYNDYGDPPHGWTMQHDNYNGGQLDGFVMNYQSHFPDRTDYATPMGFYTRKTLPTLYALTDWFRICDHWFSSVLSSTWPNRKYFISGRRDDDNDTHTIPPYPGFKTTPFFTEVERQGLSWRCYFSDLPFLGFWYPFAAKHAFSNFRTVARFVDDCIEDNLPAVSVIDPPFGLADDHPSYDVRRGQKFLGLIVDALTHTDSWKNTALLLLYDENGAFYDHVAPPSDFGNGQPVDGDLPFGFRVPAMVISPYSGVGVTKTVFDHTSVMKSVSERWGIQFDPSVYGTRWKAAPSIWGCFDFDAEPLPVGTYTKSAVDSLNPEARDYFRDVRWEQGTYQMLQAPPGGVLSHLERIFFLQELNPLDNRAKLFDTLNEMERKVVQVKRSVKATQTLER